MTFSPKTWQLDDPITPTELNRIETGIDDAHDDADALDVSLTALETTLALEPGINITANKTASVTANLGVYVRPSPSLVVVDITPDEDCRVVLSGHLTLTHSASSGTPTVAWALTNAAGATLIHGAAATRGVESANGNVALPLAAEFDLTADAQTVVHLAVSSSVSGTVTLLANRCRIVGTVVPRTS